jgi:hypothetical protein
MRGAIENHAFAGIVYAYARSREREVAPGLRRSQSTAPDPAGDSRRPQAPAPEAAPLDFLYPLALALTLRALSDQRKGKCRAGHCQ